MDDAEHKRWRSSVDTNLGEINANVKTILGSQEKQFELYGKLAKRVATLETSSVAEVAVNKWKERVVGFFLTLMGVVTGILGKILIDK